MAGPTVRIKVLQHPFVTMLGPNSTSVGNPITVLTQYYVERLGLAKAILFIALVTLRMNPYCKASN